MKSSTKSDQSELGAPSDSEILDGTRKLCSRTNWANEPVIFLGAVSIRSSACVVYFPFDRLGKISAIVLLTLLGCLNCIGAACASCDRISYCGVVISPVDGPTTTDLCVHQFNWNIPC